ncbi:MAG: isoprenylcysteine carboxylmethyltransferase family protein [Armatimonadota bacterium]
MLLFGKPVFSTFLAGLVLVVFGEAIRIWSAGHLIKSEVLTVSGPFSYVRNPLYIGSFFITCGYCTMTAGWLVWAIVMPLFFAFHGAAVIWEERFLVEQFGDDFKLYCERVPRIIPSIKANVEAEGHRFSIKQANLNKEGKTIIGTLIIVIAFVVKMMLGS